MEICLTTWLHHHTQAIDMCTEVYVKELIGLQAVNMHVCWLDVYVTYGG